jgi:glycosyltransferase involved in cell wall biosynthesis
MDNRFIIVVGSYNNAQWVESNLDSILKQDYQNYRVLYFNDGSTDNTKELVDAKIKGNNKFTTISSYTRLFKTYFFANSLNGIHDNDIIVFLDGDDFFNAENVLTYLNEIYNKTDCWMTYGGMMVWQGGDSIVEPNPQNSAIPAEVSDGKLYRKDTWRTSHLKTMRGFVWKAIDKEDLKHDGKYIVGPDDLAIMFAALELCPSEKVFRVTEPIYLYNHSKANNESRAYADNKEAKIDYEEIIRARKPYDTLSFVTPTLAGGLGNQMFEIAAAASLAKDNKAVLIVNNEEHILPNQGRNVNTYANNVFSKVFFDKSIKPQDIYRRDVCTYEPIPFKPNLKLLGHFQSYKYFHHNSGYIKSLFAPDIETDINLSAKYHPNSATAIQVRRGDYYKFPKHHPQISPDYFINAVKLTNASKIWVFTDSPDWCKENLKFDIEVEYIQEEDYLELYLMSMCKNLIISNSSFGFWAAYLNTNPNHKIYVPSVWFGEAMLAEGFNIDDLVLPEWIKV